MRQLTRDRESFCTLGIETSCDETGLCLLRGGREILAEVLASQIEEHAPYGGVIPEMASRRHQESFLPLLKELFRRGGVANPAEEIDLIAVTQGPGLMGALLVGVMSAKGLAQGWDLPLLGVNHLEGHIFANVLHDPRLEPPFLNLVVSGGHTEIYLVREYGSYELLGRTRDDAAGEAYDKVAKMLDLGYPGGPKVDALASRGNPEAFDLPVPMGNSSEIAFSFSGLKTAVLWKIEALKKEGISPLPLEDICASFQKAAVASLTGKVRLAMRQTRISRVAVSGGVAANRGLRQELAEIRGGEIYLPPLALCTDNAAMIAAAGYNGYMRGRRGTLDLSPDPGMVLE
jgi:N6-L-threonylcarbamoyladenine synthase